MAGDIPQFDEEIKIDYFDESTNYNLDPAQSQDPAQDEVSNDPEVDTSFFPYVLDERKRVIRPQGQADSRAQQQGSAQWQGTTQTLTATSTVQVTSKQIPVIGSGGSVILVSSPSIAAGIEGQEIVIKGTSNANTVTIKDGLGTRLVGACTLGLNDTLSCYFDGTVWVETARTNWISSTTSSSSSSVSTSSSSSTTTP